MPGHMTLDDVIRIPSELNQEITIGEATFSARVSDVRFDGAVLQGTVYFSKKTNQGGVDTVDYEFNMPEKTNDLIRYGNAPTRTSGYRASIVSHLANKGVIISEKLLDLVFGQIDDRLLDIYRKVFPKEVEDLVTFTGVVNEIVSPTETMSWRRTDKLYVLVNETGVCRVGLENDNHLEWPISEGECLTVTYNKSVGVAARFVTAAVEYPSGMESFSETQIWSRIVSYERVKDTSI